MTDSLNPLFCLRCGTRLARILIHERERQTCERCGWVFYPQLKVGAGMLVVRDGRLLLLQRANEPFRGCWNLPAGYVEANEAPARAAERETREESGLQVKTDRLADAYFFDDDPRGNGILLAYLCQIVHGEMLLDEESQAVGWFAAQEIPTRLAGGGHDQAILAWARGVMSDE